MKFEIELM